MKKAKELTLEMFLEWISKNSSDDIYVWKLWKGTPKEFFEQFDGFVIKKKKTVKEGSYGKNR